ncbi:MAG: hypothetical protein QM706_18930 [Nitrospira sp.]
MNVKTKTILAASLFFLWAGLAVWQWSLLQEPVHIPLTNVTGQPSAGQRPEAGGTSLRVRLDLLASTGPQHQATFTEPRNIFSVPSSEGTFEAGTAPPDSDSGETVAQQEDAPKLEQYRYLGFLRVEEGRRKNKHIAVLRRDDEVLVLKVGDRVDDHLTIKAISSESVTIQDIGTRTDQTLSLSEESVSEEPAVQD